MLSARYVEMCSKFTSLTDTKDAINEEMYWFTFLLKQKKAKNEETQTLNNQAYANPNCI